MPAKPKIDQDTADEQPAKVAKSRISGAYQLGGVWYAVDGSTLSPVETQQAHRAADKAASEARRKALLGGE